MNDRRAAERSVEAVVQEREPHVYRPGRKARAMNDGRVIRQALGDAGRTGVRRALEQGYELSEVARATVRLDDGEVFGYYPATFRVDDPSDLERSLFSSVGRFQRSWPPIRRMPLFNRRERSVVTSVLEGAPPASGSSDRRFLWRTLHEGTFDEIGAFLAAEGGWDNAFVIKNTGAVSPDRSEGSLPADTFARNAESIRAILVPAHDSETYVLWTTSRTFFTRKYGVIRLTHPASLPSELGTSRC